MLAADEADQEPVAKKPRPRVKLACQECGRKWFVALNASDPQCPNCNSVDWEVL